MMVGPVLMNQAQCEAVPPPPHGQGASRRRRRGRKTSSIEVVGPSRGSRNHFQGLCRPCLLNDRPEGCLRGVLCNFCHFKHDEVQWLEALKSQPPPEVWLVPTTKLIPTGIDGGDKFCGLAPLQANNCGLPQNVHLSL